MKLKMLATILCGATMLCVSGSALSQAKYDFGKREYGANCAGCHGMSGRGDGDYKPWLTKSPTELHTLSKNNGGVFPVERMYQVIDGRQFVPAHGSRDMPIWGEVYRAKAGESYMDVPYDPEAFVRTRILALIDYIHRLQVK
jgi:mono/diheme cytochrome c family protein